MKEKADDNFKQPLISGSAEQTEHRQPLAGVEKIEIDKKDKQRWEKLDQYLQATGGLKGGQEFYSAERLIDLLDGIRAGVISLETITDIKNLREKAGEFMAVDQIENNPLQIQVGQEIKHPFQDRLTKVVAVGDRIQVYTPRAYVDDYQAGGREGAYESIVGSNYNRKLCQLGYVLVEEKNEPAVEITTHIFGHPVLVLPMNILVINKKGLVSTKKNWWKEKK